MYFYKNFLEKLDIRLKEYATKQKEHIFCSRGCCYCCEKGDYPLSQLELEYIMFGYSTLDLPTKRILQENFSNIQKGGVCPFLINKECSIYPYRPIVCRVHGLVYLCKENLVKVPFCVNLGLNFSKVYKDGYVMIDPIKENLDTPSVLNNLDFGEIRNLYDWLYNK